MNWFVVIALNFLVIFTSNFLVQGVPIYRIPLTSWEDYPKGKLVCSHQAAQLKCSNGRLIKVLHADYGRKDNFICGGGTILDCSSKTTTTAMLKEKCNDRRRCKVRGDGKGLTDACPGVNKYLHIAYKCEKKAMSVMKPSGVSVAAEAPKPGLPKCGVSKSTRVRARVVEGRKAVPGTWPWQVMLLKQYDRKEFTCGGTLIHPKWVITAAHCIKSRKRHYYTVRLGEYDRWVNESKEQDIKVKRAIRHPEYFRPSPLNNDIALLELEEPARFNERVGAACLPEVNNELDVNDPKTRCYITGWGRRKHKGYMSSLLREAEVPPVSRVKCAVRLAKSPGGKNRKITKQMLCGGDDVTGSGACQGDSGGPYVCSNKEGYYEVHGVVSWGSPICSLKQRFTVFAQVSKFRKWIDKYINEGEDIKG